MPVSGGSCRRRRGGVERLDRGDTPVSRGGILTLNENTVCVRYDQGDERDGHPDFRLYRGWRGIGGFGSGEPAERGSEVSRAGAGSGPRESSLVAHSCWLREADRKPSRQLALFVGAG